MATAGVPLLAGTLPGLFLSRAAVGLGEGVAPSAATDIVARAIPTDQRSRAISFIFGGLHVGRCVAWSAAGGREKHNRNPVGRVDVWWCVCARCCAAGV